MTWYDIHKIQPGTILRSSVSDAKYIILREYAMGWMALRPNYKFDLDSEVIALSYAKLYSFRYLILCE